MPLYIADFHLHSKYSRATSKDMDLEHINEWCQKKGIGLVGTADFTHPEWFKELKEKLEPLGNGLYQLKSQVLNPKSLITSHQSPVYFILTTEISCIYSKAGKIRRIHLVIFAPSLEVVEEINTKLSWIGNLKADGRPILGLDAKELLKIILDISEECLVVPSHIWTPWFSLFGSNSGFNSVEECFGELTPKIYAIETGLSCYDKKTEVLTNNGWKKFSKVSYRDKICTLNIKTDEIEFQNPTRIFAYKYKGKMYKLKTKRVDLLVTLNHKLLVSNCDFRKPPRFFLKKAELLFNKSKRFKKDGSWIGKDIEYFTLPAVKMKHGSRYYSRFRDKKEKKIPMKSWLKFFGSWVAEGWTNEGKNGDYNVCLANRNKALLSEMKKILESFGYNVYQEDKINNTIRVRNYQLFHYLKQFGKCSDKFIPPDIKSLSKKLLEIFLEYYIKGDGHIYERSGKGLSATTTSIRLRDDLQEIALKIGISAYYKLGYKKGTPFRGGSYKDRIYRQNEDSWVVYFIRQNRHTVLPSTIKKYNYIESWVDYDGLVFCVAVPNQVVYIRRNGIPLWCGNSDPPMNWRLKELDTRTITSNSDAHSAANLGREANVFEGEDIDYKSILEALKNKGRGKNLKLIYTIEFFPEEGKYHFDGHRGCEINFSPKETKKHKNICPKCKKLLTVGVMNRVEELADREEGFKPEDRIPFKSLVPLGEIIAEALGITKGTKGVKEEYERLIKQGENEFNVLLNLSEEELKKITQPRIAEGILRVREKKVKIIPGYDGVYGKVQVFDDKENLAKQAKLF